MAVASSYKGLGMGCSTTTSQPRNTPTITTQYAANVMNPNSECSRRAVTASKSCPNSGNRCSLHSGRMSTICSSINPPQSYVGNVSSSTCDQGVMTTLDGQPTADASAPPPPATDSSALRANMQSRYEQAYSMSQLYAAERPPPIPPSEHERRRRVKDIQEVVDAGRRKGLGEEVIRNGLTQMDALLPGVLSLHRMKPSDWATVASDVNTLAEKIILLKSLYPAADIFKIVFKKPKLLLLSTKRLEQDAAAIMRLLSSAPNPCAILESTPDLVDPLSLSRCLASLAASFPGQDPVMMLQQHPDILANLGSEAAVELTAEYGELSTKD